MPLALPDCWAGVLQPCLNAAIRSAMDLGFFEIITSPITTIELSMKAMADVTLGHCFFRKST